MASSSSSGAGVSFPGMLAVLFIGLKLAGVINWSWWWVLAPLWIPLIILFLILVGVGIYFLVKAHRERRL